MSAREAIDRVDRNADDHFRFCAKIALATVVAAGEDFTSDDVWIVLERDFPHAETHEPRAMGAIISGASRAGFIVRTGAYRESIRPQCHSRPLAVWKTKG